MRDKIDLKPELISQIVDLSTQDKSSREIANELGLSQSFITKFMRSDEYKTAIRDAIRVRISKLAGKVVKTIENALNEGNLEAVKISLKVLGSLEAEPPQTQGTQSITVVLPGASIKPDIEVKNE